MPSYTLAQKIRRQLRYIPISYYIFGLAVRHKFTSAGYITLAPGLPLPKIINRGGEIHVGNIGLFPGVRFECMQGARISIGKGTYLNRNTHIVAAESVSIGQDCKIAWDVLIMDTDQHGLQPGQEAVAKPVTIENNVWIGARSIILKGVTIGHNSVVAAGAIVTKDVPPFSVVANPPARVIRSLA